MANYDILVKIGGDISGLTSATTKATSSISNMGKRLTVAGAAMTGVFGAATYGMVKGIGASVSAAAKFETAWAGVTKTVDGNAKQMKALQRQILSVTKAMPQSTTEIFAVAEAAGQLGIQRKNIASFTKTMLDLGVSTNMTSDEAATALARLANITGMPQKNFDRLGATIVDLGNNFATTEKEITDMSLRLAGQGKQAGLSEHQILGLAAAMSSVGINAEAGGTAMSTVMKKIGMAVDRGGDKLTGFADLAGMSNKKFAEAWNKDAAGALDKVIHGLARSKKEGANLTAVLNGLGIKGIRESDTLLRLAGNANLLTRALSTAKGAWKSNTALLAEANKRYKTFDSQLGVTKKVMTEFGRVVGTPIKDALATLMSVLNKIVISITNFVAKFNEANPTLAKVGAYLTIAITALLGLGTAIGAVITAIGLFLMSWGAIAESLVFAPKLLGALKLAFSILTGPIGITIAILSALGTIFFSLYKDNEKFRNSVNAVASAIKSGFIASLKALGSALKAVGSFFNAVGTSIKSGFTKALADTNSGLSKFVAFCASVGSGALSLLKKTFDTTADSLNRFATFLNNNVGKALAFVLPIMQKVGTVLDNALGKSIDFINGSVEKMGGQFGKLGGVISIAVGVLSKIGLALAGITGPLGIAISLLISFASAWIKTGELNANGVTKVFDNLTKTIDNVSNYLNKNLPAFIDAGGDLIVGLINGITNQIPKVTSIIEKLITIITTALVTILPKVIEIGIQLLTNLIEGITKAIPTLTAAAVQIVNTLITTIANVLPLLIGVGLKIVLSLLNAITAALPKLIVAGISIINGLLNAVLKAIPLLITLGIQVITALLNAIVTALPVLITAGLQIITALVGAILKALPVIITAAIKILITLVNAIVTALPMIISAGIQILTALIKGIIQILPALIKAAITLVMAIVTALVENIGKIIAAGVQLVMALIKGLIQILPQLIQAAITLLLAIVDAFIKNLPKLIDAGVKMITALIKGLIKVLPKLVVAAVKLAVELIKTLIKYSPQILAAGVKLILALIKGILQVLGQLLAAGGRLIVQLVSKLGSYAGQMLAKGVYLIAQFISGLINKGSNIGKTGKSLLATLVNSFPGTALVKNGVALIGGLLNGMKKKYQEVKSFVGGIASWIKDHKGPISYDKKLLIPAGKAIMLGLNQGLNSGFKGISKSVSGMATAIKDSLNAKQMQKAATSLGTSIQNYIDKGFYSKKSNVGKVNNLAKTIKTQQAQLKAVVTRRKNTTKKLTKLNKQLTATPKTKKTSAKRSGLANQITTAKNQLAGYNAQVKAINNRIKTSQSKLKTLAIDKKQASQALGLASIQSFIKKQTNKLVSIAKQRDTIVAKLKDANKKLSDLTKESKKYAEDAAKTVTDYASVTNLQGTTNLKASDIDTYLQQRVKAIKTFQTNIAKLRKKGVNKNIIEDILNAGVDGGSAYAKALAGADSKTITSINKTQKSIETASKSMGTAAANAMYGAGINAAKGLIKGLQSQQKALNKQADKIGASIVKAIKKKLKIHSPSRTLRDEVGQYIPLGIVEGINSKISDIQQASDRMVAAAVPDTSRLSQSISADMNGAISQSVTADVDGQGNMFDKLASRIDSLGDRLEGMAIQIDGKAAGKILRPHISEEEAKEQRRQFKAKGLSFNN